MVGGVAAAAGAVFLWGPPLESAESPSAVRTVAVTPRTSQDRRSAHGPLEHPHRVDPRPHRRNLPLALFRARDPRRAGRRPSCAARPKRRRSCSRRVGSSSRRERMRAGGSRTSGSTLRSFFRRRPHGRSAPRRRRPDGAHAPLHVRKPKRRCSRGSFDKSWAKTVRTMGIPPNVAESLKTFGKGAATR